MFVYSQWLVQMKPALDDCMSSHFKVSCTDVAETCYLADCCLAPFWGARTVEGCNRAKELQGLLYIMEALLLPPL